MELIAAVAAGLLLRVGIPIAITVIFILLLRRLDARWQAEIDQSEQRVDSQEGSTPRTGCWAQRGCEQEDRAKCQAYGSDIPCWQIFRDERGRLRDQCVNCEVFQKAPLVAMP